MRDAAKARNAFTQLRTLLPPSLHSTVEDLESICEEERQLTLQRQLHLWLHGWLLVHIPLSVALILLAAAVGLMAWLSFAQIGGQTGDVLGALEQVSEIVVLLVAAA